MENKGNLSSRRLSRWHHCLLDEWFQSSPAAQGPQHGSPTVSASQGQRSALPRAPPRAEQEHTEPRGQLAGRWWQCSALRCSHQQRLSSSAPIPPPSPFSLGSNSTGTSLKLREETRPAPSGRPRTFHRGVRVSVSFPGPAAPRQAGPDERSSAAPPA